MSLLATAKANGHEPHAWLTDVLTRLPTARCRGRTLTLRLALKCLNSSVGAAQAAIIVVQHRDHVAARVTPTKTNSVQTALCLVNSQNLPRIETPKVRVAPGMTVGMPKIKPVLPASIRYFLFSALSMDAVSVQCSLKVMPVRRLSRP